MKDFPGQKKGTHSSRSNQSKMHRSIESVLAWFSRIGVIYSCSNFKLVWEMALLHPEDRQIVGLEKFDLEKKIHVNEYNQNYYIE